MKITLISMENEEASYNYGLRIISACLKKEGHKTQMIFLNNNLGNLFYEKTLSDLINLLNQSDIIGISSSSSVTEKTVKLIRDLEKLNKVLVWGGAHPTGDPLDCLNYVDIICVGEGENAICELAKRIEEKKYFYDIPNLWFKNNGEIIRNKSLLDDDLNSLPFPDYDFQDHWVIQNHELINAKDYYTKINGIIIHTTRGCPYNCTYCCNSFLHKLYDSNIMSLRKRSASHIIQELVNAKNKFPNLNFVWFTDDCFLLGSANELEKFFKEYKEKIGINFRCYVSTAIINDEKMKLAIDAGLTEVEMGIQTGSESLNKDLYSRNIKNTDIIRIDRLLNIYHKKLRIRYHLIIFNPYESSDDILKTINLAMKLTPPFHLEGYVLQFFPGTELHKKALKDNMISEINKTYRITGPYKAINGLKRDIYLNFLVALMLGPGTNIKIGRLPRIWMKFFINYKVIKYFEKHKKQVRFIVVLCINFLKLISRDRGSWYWK